MMATVSNGICPIGIIDGIKTSAFTQVSWNEEVFVAAVGVAGTGGKLVTPIDLKVELRKPNVIPSSFNSTVNVVLNPVNGIITFVAGTELNYDAIGAGTPNAIRAIVNYTYYVANIPGDDSTQGSGRIAVWFQRMFFQTNQYESNQQYPINANLYCSETGFLTTRRPSARHPSIAIVTAPPTSLNSMIEALFL